MNNFSTDNNPTTINNSRIDEEEMEAQGAGNPSGLDISQFRLPQDFNNLAPTKNVQTVTRIGKPKTFEFIRVNPDPEMTFRAYLLEKKEEGACYMIHPDLIEEFAGEIRPKLLVVTIDRENSLGIWPLNLSLEGRHNPWNDSALAVADIAKEKWVKIKSNHAIQSYEAVVATGSLPEPKWPKLNLEEFVAKAFGDRLVSKVDHPVLQALRGAI